MKASGYRLVCQPGSAQGYLLTVLSGSVLELQGDLDGAIQAYERAIRQNAWSVPAMQAISTILRAKDQFGVAIDYLRTILKIDSANGEVWGSLGTPISCQSTRSTLLTCLANRPLLSHDG